jgi:hypothetical protein
MLVFASGSLGQQKKFVFLKKHHLVLVTIKCCYVHNKMTFDLSFVDYIPLKEKIIK